MLDTSTDMNRKERRVLGLALIVLSFTVMGVSAYVYQQATMTLSQTIVEIASITVKNSDLGTINEGESKTITELDIANLGDAISITTTTSPVYLHLASDVDSLTGSYSIYDIDVLYATVPGGGTGIPGNTVCTLDLSVPDYSSITLDAIGTWTFDLELETAASSVDLDTDTTVTITVSAESS